MVIKLDRSVSRRNFIKQAGSIGAITAVAPTVLFTQCGLSGYWADLNPETKEAFAGAIKWIVEYTLDKTFPRLGKGKDAILKLIDELAIKRVFPRPTSNSFHNSHASKYIVTNPEHQFNSQYSYRVSYYLQLDEYIRSGTLDKLLDLSTSEIRRLRAEKGSYDTILYPVSDRERPSISSVSRYAEVAETKYKTDPSKLELEYVRYLRDRQSRPLYESYGVRDRRTGEADLLISE